MAVCLACGTDNVEDESLCVDCGTPLAFDHAHEIRRFATVVTSDLKGSTALGERLDPESLREILTRYFDEMRLVFERTAGPSRRSSATRSWPSSGSPAGAPTTRSEPSRRQPRRARPGESQRRARTGWGVRLVVRTGVATGDVVVGEARAGQHVLTGDTMRISSAMEQNAPALELLIADSTYALVRTRSTSNS